ncbi:MAG TPA: hypothetical protein VKI44_40230 [Acetobacteraceae bacterium]|nr:hypothetical protein [Acetobacteraceae bacterium]
MVKDDVAVIARVAAEPVTRLFTIPSAAVMVAGAAGWIITSLLDVGTDCGDQLSLLLKLVPDPPTHLMIAMAEPPVGQGGP